MTSATRSALVPLSASNPSPATGASNALVIHGESDMHIVPAGTSSDADVIALRDDAVPDRDDVIAILTYNIWMNEECQVEARMDAVGDVILRHQPHVVLFQEVTPLIFSLLSSSFWWRDMGFVCSVDEAEATRPYFTMLITRLPCHSFHRTPFAETTMDRELVTAAVETAAARAPQTSQNSTTRASLLADGAAAPPLLTYESAATPPLLTYESTAARASLSADSAAASPLLKVATAHLESPMSFQRPGIGPRNTQAREALDILGSERNVVFGGDMNWNERRDGRVPLPPGWFDPWHILHPIEKYLKPGYTYDGRTNRMIGGALQGRLDRFWCRLEDFDAESIEMVGTEAIPGLRCDREFPSGDKVRRVSLPVFPSDHYGVLLRIRPKSKSGPVGEVLRICSGST